jgi:hypothetical protein
MGKKRFPWIRTGEEEEKEEGDFPRIRKDENPGPFPASVRDA